jgi:hypothetical protein
MIKTTIKKPLRYVHNLFREMANERQIKYIISQRSMSDLDRFDFDEFKSKISGFIGSMQTDNSGVHYRYSMSCSRPTLYASTYACMSLSLLGDLGKYSDESKRKWAKYFDSFQKSDDGLFYDPIVMNDFYVDSDWWGARHLALHMISAYTDLGMRPKYPFIFLKKYYDIDFIRLWLDSIDWHQAFPHTLDIDNKIMNIACLLQFQRDFWSDEGAGNAIEYLKCYLRNKINDSTGLWGIYETEDPSQLSRMVQFAYHLLLIYFYDKDFSFNNEKIVKYVLRTQNKFGGYGVRNNSSACEDIDSIDILIRLAPYVPMYKCEIEASLQKAFNWVLCNQVKDFGFVFRLGESMIYGHDEMSNEVNSGSMFPTWFRTLSLAYIAKYYSVNKFHINSAPGY